MNNYTLVLDYLSLSDENKKTAERLLSLSSKKKLLLDRGEKWLLEKSLNGSLRLVLNNNKLVGLFCLTSFYNEQRACQDVYGEACVCRMKTINIIEILRDIIKIEAKKLGGNLFGFYFSGNTFSEQLFDLEHDFNLTEPEHLPQFVAQRWVKDSGKVNAFVCDVEQFSVNELAEFIHLDAAS